ncbi:MAG: DUF1192 domain-containing protein [Alphaproteobacteria bacterium]|jgi:uncharacterized small protein (DUF1192 family)|nr:DUF1192 domain-containing protein [Rhodospirillaceae bacterium]MDP6031018.1 DUF1192 domain-containing protein [Alphaproteobacteria bacterium]MDP7183317.1 DUF1192 domain-containing protein [Alphaproteobacteria bacterium]MDP7190549.1 DUF1192 domain-containing protein [Alphaproteobacteria bacterium]HJO89091.1 DUF1192 domain-containing protein [Alphaproteobacteria bacterium]|tara:strand:+ start:113 stop:304 length:192 start_codon:yes stop_codon:yes gene_type:complete
MEDEDNLPLHVSDQSFIPRKMDTLSVEELMEYIIQMETEITCAREMIEAKKQLRDGAEGLFKK